MLHFPGGTKEVIASGDLLVLLVIVDFVVPEKRLARQQPEKGRGIGAHTLSPSPQKKFLVRMFWYGYSGLSALGWSSSS